MKPQITIRIDGPQGSGKSVLAHHLACHLQHLHGVKVRLHDDDGQLQAPDTECAALPNHFDADVTITVEQK